MSFEEYLLFIETRLIHLCFVGLKFQGSITDFLLQKKLHFLSSGNLIPQFISCCMLSVVLWCSKIKYNFKYYQSLSFKNIPLPVSSILLNICSKIQKQNIKKVKFFLLRTGQNLRKQLIQKNVQRASFLKRSMKKLCLKLRRLLKKKSFKVYLLVRLEPLRLGNNAYAF